MDKRNTLQIFMLFFGALALLITSCTGKSGNSSNNTQTGYTTNRIDATRESLNNLKTNANQRATAIDSLGSGNTNNNNSY